MSSFADSVKKEMRKQSGMLTKDDIEKILFDVKDDIGSSPVLQEISVAVEADQFEAYTVNEAVELVERVERVLMLDK